MFQPRFEITPRLNQLLTAIAVLREKITRALILPKREIALVRSARLRMIYSSTSIEGNPLSFKEVSQVLAGKIVTGIREKDRLEITNYEEAMRYIDRVFGEGEKIVSEKTILKIHQLLTREILDSQQSGHYRRGPVFIVERPSNRIVYQAPEAKKAPLLMKDLIAWINQSSQVLSPVMVAAIAHHQLVTIHPFIDGNGRTARALATLILYQRGCDIRKMFALEDYYNLNRPSYYQAIREANEKKDLSRWLEYFALGLLKEMESVWEKVEKFSLEAKQGKQIYLSQRQREILDFSAVNTKIFRSDVVDICSVSPRTAHRELKQLVKLGFLKASGKGRSSHYLLG